MQSMQNMKLETLCRGIELPPEAVRAVLPHAGRALPAHLLTALTKPETAKAAYGELEPLRAEEHKGLDLLAWMLLAALHTHGLYREKGIGDKIYFDTMKCFSRFVGEHRTSFGAYGFDRGWWVYRQLSMTLFRVGELEYEFCGDEGRIHLHIPSDAAIDVPACKRSLEEFKDFVKKFYPQRAGDPVEMESWLLSPALERLLRADSKILRFRRCFEITDWNEEDAGFLHWVYGGAQTEYGRLPEDTSLQRNMKAYLLQGGKVGSAKGVLKDFC